MPARTSGARSPVASGCTTIEASSTEPPAGLWIVSSSARPPGRRCGHKTRSRAPDAVVGRGCGGPPPAGIRSSSPGRGEEGCVQRIALVGRPGALAHAVRRVGEPDDRVLPPRGSCSAGRRRRRSRSRRRPGRRRDGRHGPREAAGRPRRRGHARGCVRSRRRRARHRRATGRSLPSGAAVAGGGAGGARPAEGAAAMRVATTTATAVETARTATPQASRAERELRRTPASGCGCSSSRNACEISMRTSAKSWRRSRGSRSRQRRRRRRAAGGVAAGRRSHATSLRSTAASTSDVVSPRKSRVPVSISNRMTPNAQMSVRRSTACPRACSGDM